MIILCCKKVADVCICLTCEARVNSAKGTTTNMMKHLRHRESKVVFYFGLDWHRVDANQDPDPTFQFDADPDLASGFTNVGKLEIF
jgi:hypothetical protein